MKKLVYLLPLALFGCDFVEKTKEEFVNAPADFWLTVREIILYVVDFLWQAASGWLTGLLG